MPSVLLDTSFFLRLLDDTDPLHYNAIGYFKYYLQNEYDLFISTISIAEYCVKGTIDELPLKDLRVIPFNIDHAKRCGEFANKIFSARTAGSIEILDRKLIPNDTKLFAQADLNIEIEAFVTSDTKSQKTINILQKDCHAKFKLVDINTPYNETYGILDL